MIGSLPRSIIASLPGAYLFAKDRQRRPLYSVKGLWAKGEHDKDSRELERGTDRVVLGSAAVLDGIMVGVFLAQVRSGIYGDVGLLYWFTGAYAAKFILTQAMQSAHGELK
jgi:hypothetical protein